MPQTKRNMPQTKRNKSQDSKSNKSQDSKSNKNVNKGSRTQVYKVPNMQFSDIVHTSADCTDELNRNSSSQELSTSTAENLMPRKKNESTIARTQTNQATTSTAENKDKEQENEENLKDMDSTDNMFESIVVDDEVANVAKVVARMNGHLAKKIAKLNEQVTYIEEKTQDIEVRTKDSNKEQKNKTQSKENAAIYEKLVIQENNMTIFGDKNSTLINDDPVIYMKESFKEKLRHGETIELISKNSMVRTNNKSHSLDKSIASEENGPSDNVPMIKDEKDAMKMTDDHQNDNELIFDETGNLFDFRDLIEEENFMKYDDDKSSEKKEAKKQSRLQRRNTARKTKRKRPVTRTGNFIENDNRQGYNLALILVCSVVVNVIISIAIVGLFKCCDSKMIECKLDKHIQYTQDMFNQPMDEKGFLKFYFNKKMIHAKLKVLVETLEKRDTSHMGVLITRHHILTAGHCLPRAVPHFLQFTNHYIAWAGNSDSRYIDDKIARRHSISDSNFKSGEQIRTCARWFKHPRQDSSRFINDVGVIRCEVAFDLIPQIVETVPVASNFPFQAGVSLEMYGWGVVDDHNNRSLQLKKYTTFMQSTSACVNHYVNITSNYHICTHSNTSHSYKGDSGAPALYTIQPIENRCGENVGHKTTDEEIDQGETRNCPTNVLYLDDLNEELKQSWAKNKSGLVQTVDYDCYLNENQTNACLINSEYTESFFHLDFQTNSTSHARSQHHLSAAQEMSREKPSPLPKASPRQCGNRYYAVASSQFTHYSCIDGSMCFTSNNNRTCANMRALCCQRNISLTVTCSRNGTLHHPATRRGATTDRDRNYDVNIFETKRKNKTSDSANTDSSQQDQFSEDNFVCSLENTDNNLKPKLETYGQKVVIGITSFHLDTYVILTNITREYYRFIQEVINMT